MKRRKKFQKEFPKKILMFLICAVFCTYVSGCSGQAGQPSQQDEIMQQSTSSQEDTQAGQIAQSGSEGNPGPQGISGEAADGARQAADGEEYVYDYQVGMDPIPKEIADLGNPCQGTIHAFPSKIRIGLTEKKMEEDPELKAEVEKRIDEAKQKLSDEIGGEFRINGVDVSSDMAWFFHCTELETGNEFVMSFVNFQYYAKKHNEKTNSDGIYAINNYYSSKENTAEKKEKYQTTVRKYFPDATIGSWFQVDPSHLDVYIIQYTNDDIDKEKEQEKILDLWNSLYEGNKECYISIIALYYPEIYRKAIDQKYMYGNPIDFYLDKENAKILMAEGELKEFFYYEDTTEAGGEKDIRKLLQDHSESTVWLEYWQ